MFVILNKHSDAFWSSAEDLKLTKIIYQTMKIGDSAPVRQNMRRIPYKQIEVLNAKVDKLQSNRMMETSFSPIASPTILVKKQHKS